MSLPYRLLDIFFDCLTLGERPACNQYFREDFRDLRAFVYRNGGDASCPDYHYSSTVLHIIHKRSPGTNRLSSPIIWSAVFVHLNRNLNLDLVLEATSAYECKSMSISLATFEAVIEETKVVS